MVDISIKIGGPAGAGVMTVGKLFAKTFQRYDIYTFFSNDYPSLIRGGHNVSYVRGSDEKIYAGKREIDLLIALDENTISLHKDELVEGGIILFDKDTIRIKKQE